MPGAEAPAAPLLEAREVSRQFPVRGSGALLQARRMQTAVDRVSLAVQPGEVLALVGESGSGKTTLGRMLLGLTRPDSGAVLYQGQDIAALRGSARAAYRQAVQVVFQDSGGSLNPRHTVAENIALPLRYNRGLAPDGAAREVDTLLELVQLGAAHFRNRLPHELSGGQRQRVGIARALASRPRVVIADEPVSALDVSVRAQILRLMFDLQQTQGLAFLFITHDLGVVRAFAQRVAVMYQGQIVEQGTADAVLDAPQDAYTRRLLAATPVPDPRRQHGA
ncbi:MAG: ABC transporter ATP-binding protein [Rhodoferax sp.]|nr:ABC transporter ATP-binding protein [Rhodoferax sp.]